MRSGFVRRMVGQTVARLGPGCLWILVLGGLVLPDSVEGANRIRRTPEEVEALIKEVGAAQPDWWDSVELSYPDTLDMDWPLKPSGPWNNQVNVGQYIWDVINPNPGRWKQGIKLVHHLMIKHKDDRAKLARSTQALGAMFHNFMEDWPRAAFWWRTSMKYGGYVEPTKLANCYWQMGCEEMARDMLVRAGGDYTRNGEVIKLWADMGQIDKALQLAEQKARFGMPQIAYLAAGNACRQAGRYDTALSYYQKVIQAPPPDKEKMDDTRAVEQAQEAIEAIRLYETLDLSNVGDGAYSGKSTAFNGPMQVEVRVGSGRITSVRVTQHREKQFYTAIEETPRQIVEKQTVKGVDAVTGATITSQAIINATARALTQGVK